MPLRVVEAAGKIASMTRSTGVDFGELIAAGESEPVAGWDFSWFDGRATEERPAWGYARRLAERMGKATAALDIQTGGGEVLAGIGQAPPALAATESWPPNVELARRNLRSLGATVTAVDDDADLPFPDDSFDLVVSRHPTVTLWAQIARVLRPGGSYFSQQVGAGSNRELIDFMMGPQPVGEARNPQRAAAAAQQAGLTVTDLREQALEVQFFDVGAVVYFLRKVLWTVPDFTVERYRDRLARLHDQIQAEGPFTCHAQRFLIEARQPR
jgi:SAM-dependent methyltransferase